MMLKRTLATLALAGAIALPAHAGNTLDAAIGGGLGGAVGAALGNEIGGRNGAILGGAVGGGVGAAITTPRREARREVRYVYEHDRGRPRYYKKRYYRYD